VLVVLKTSFNSAICSALAARSTSSLRLAVCATVDENRRLRCAVPAVATRTQGRRFRALPLAWLAPCKVQRFEPIPARLPGPLSALPVCAGDQLSRKNRRPQSWTGRGLTRVAALISRFPFRCPGGCPKGKGSLCCGFREARKGVPTGKPARQWALSRAFRTVCQDLNEGLSPSIRGWVPAAECGCPGRLFRSKVVTKSQKQAVHEENPWLQAPIAS
jgi:hypothetical protein